MYGRSALDGKYYVLNHAGVLNWGRWKEVVEGMIVLTHETLDLYPLLRQQYLEKGGGSVAITDRLGI